MENSTKIFISVAVLVVALVGFLNLINEDAEPGRYDSFAECLTQNGVKMFGAYWCPHCEAQEKMFGNSWEKVEYVECSLPNRAGQTQICIREGITSYPTWEFGDGVRVSGELSFGELSERSGCPFEEG